MKNKLLLIISFTLIFSRIFSQTKIELVKDIFAGVNNGIGISDKTQYLVVDNKLFFIGKTQNEGSELWISDGTSNGTKLVKDINVGTSDSKLSNFSEMGGKLYFIADDGTNGRELWVSDGTEIGTKMVKNISSGSQSPFNSSSSGNFFIAFKNKLYFSAALDFFSSIELWETDGTDAGTKPFLVDASTKVKYPRAFCVADSILYMRAEIDDVSGYELVRTNGTPEGTRMVKDIYEGSNQSYIEKINYIGNKLYFFAESKNSLGGTTGYEPWVSDGTEIGTKKIKEINPSGSCTLASQTKKYEFIEYNGKIYFSATDSLEENQALWSYDPSNSNLQKVTKDPEGYGNQYNTFNVFNNNLYYFNGQNNNEISSTNGTTSKSVYNSSSITNWSPSNQMLENNNLYIVSDDVFFGSSILLEVTKSNDVTILNNLVTNFNYSYGMNKINNTILLFISTNGTGEELYRISNTVDTKELKTDILNVYPNPIINNYFNFANHETGILNIYNIQGEKIKQYNIENTGIQSIDTQNLLNGIYLIEFKHNSNVSVAKIIINNI